MGNGAGQRLRLIEAGGPRQMCALQSRVLVAQPSQGLEEVRWPLSLEGGDIAVILGDADENDLVHLAGLHVNGRDVFPPQNDLCQHRLGFVPFIELLERHAVVAHTQNAASLVLPPGKVDLRPEQLSCRHQCRRCYEQGARR